MIVATELKIDDRISITGFKRHNATVLKTEDIGKSIKLTVSMDYVKEGEERITIIYCPYYRKFKEAVDD